MTFQRAIIRDFSKGWNTSSVATLDAENAYAEADAPGYARPWAIQGAQFPRLLNLFVGQEGRLVVRNGQHAVTGSFADWVVGLYRYVGPTLRRLLLAQGTAVVAINESDNSLAYLQTDLALGVPIEFVPFYDRVYWTDGVQRGRVWNGAGASRLMGILPPTASGTFIGYPGSHANGAGTLNSNFTGGIAYQWRITFVNASGVESNPSDPSPPLGLNSEQALVTGLPLATDTQVTARNVYRLGGTSTAWRYVGQVPDNTTTDFADNTADTALSLTALSFAHDAPPVGPTFFYPHKQRIFSAGDPAHPYRLSFSSLEFPEYWPTYVQDTDIDGGFFDIDPEYGEPIVGLCGTGSLLVVARPGAVYVFLGDTQNDFIIRKVSSFGCVARRSLIQCKNEVLFLGPDGMVYRLDDQEPTPIALPIEATLKGIPLADLSAACAAYVDQRYILCIPRSSASTPIIVSYDFRSGAWSDMSDPALGATAYFAARGQELYGDLLFATRPGTVVAGSPFRGVISALGRADRGVSVIPIEWQTPSFEFGRPGITKRAQMMMLEGLFTGTVTATITASTPGRPDITRTYPLTPRSSAGPLFDGRVHPELVGRQLSVTVAGNVSLFELNTLTLGFSYLRDTY